MRRAFSAIAGTMLLAASIFLMKPAVSRAASALPAAVRTQVPLSANEVQTSPDQSLQQFANACLNAIGQPTAALRADAMAKLMNDPSFATNMSRLMTDPQLAFAMAGFMNSPEGRSLMGSMMGGWAGGQSPGASVVPNSNLAGAYRGLGCH